MFHDIFSNPDQLLQYYHINVADLAALKSRVWTQIQHYTWFLSLLLVVGPVTLLTQKPAGSVQHFSLIFGLPVAGVLLAVIAFSIIRKDLIYMSFSDSKLIYLEKQLGVLRQAPMIDARLRRGLGEDFSVVDDAAEQARVGFFSFRKWRIRKLILLSFIFYIAVGIAEIIYFLFAL